MAYLLKVGSEIAVTAAEPAISGSDVDQATPPTCPGRSPLVGSVDVPSGVRTGCRRSGGSRPSPPAPRPLTAGRVRHAEIPPPVRPGRAPRRSLDRAFSVLSCRRSGRRTGSARSVGQVDQVAYDTLVVAGWGGPGRRGPRPRRSRRVAGLDRFRTVPLTWPNTPSGDVSAVQVGCLRDEGSPTCGSARSELRVRPGSP
jgi:hypothetical protein